MTLNQLDQAVAAAPTAERQAVMFIGHGSPMNIIRDNDFTRALEALGKKTDKPAAVLVISAHWLTRGATLVSTNPKPETIHDFGGFPEALYAKQYPAKGAPAQAQEVITQVQSIKVHADHEMGLDHGAWSLLTHMWPKADVPVFQMSIDYSQPASYHYALAGELRRLRERGVLIIGSGNLVHNLRRIDFEEDAAVYDWAREFDDWAREKLVSGDYEALIHYEKQGALARAAIPTNDHYLPMIYSLGLLRKGEGIKFTFEGFQNASISMRSFQSV